MSPGEDASRNRRRLLKSVGTGRVMSGMGTLTDVDSEATPQGARRPSEVFRNADQVRSMLSEFGGDTLRELSDHGHLPEASADPFVGNADSDPAVDRVHVHEGESLTPITATRTFGDRTVHLVVEPGNDRGFAVVDPDDAEKFVVAPDGEAGGLCWWESRCTDECPDGDCPGVIVERECCEEDGRIDCASWSRTSACCGGPCGY